jgi:RNA polymerase sigma-32 factor
MLVTPDESGMSPPLRGGRRRIPDGTGKKRSTGGINKTDSASSPSRKPQFLTAEQESYLISRWQCERDFAARARVMLAFQPLVECIAASYSSRSGVPVEELIQEGQFGLMRAIDKFKPERGFRFASYANPWVRSTIVDALKKKIADAGVVSLNAQINEDGDEFQDLIAVPVEDDTVFQAGDFAHARERLDELIADKLDPREAQIIADRHVRDKPLTLDEVGGSLGVSRERVRQLEARAIKKLRTAALLKTHVGKHRQKMREAMAQFYADATPIHHNIDGFIDAAKKRFPEAIQPDRIAAHRTADKLHPRVDLTPAEVAEKRRDT